MKVLIIANARYKGGLSGGDAIYENFKKYWDCEFTESNLIDVDFKPFSLCYVVRIAMSTVRAILDTTRYDLVYSASDFLSDSIPAFIYKLKGIKWVAGYYLEAFKSNPFHYYSQKLVKFLIRKYADMVIVTNPTMYPIFHSKRKTWINGGIDLSLTGTDNHPRVYDAVFCGRIHPTKGIDELLEIWELVRKDKPKARLALIGDGDLGKDYIKHKLFAKHGRNNTNGIDLLGYMGEERFKVYKLSKVVLYPTPPKFDHFSMSPIEAMACGCPIIHFDMPTFRNLFSESTTGATSIKDFADKINSILNIYDKYSTSFSIQWASQFCYKKQAVRVLNDIRKELYA